MMRLGTFPGMWMEDEAAAIRELSSLTSGLLYRDILEFERLRRAPLIIRLLRALALQLGSEVSYQELASLLNVDIKTVERYIFLLEEAFVIFRMPSLKRNARNEVSRLRKVYFYDLGVRNSLIQNYNLLELRNDIGPLWENFCIVERLKYNEYHGVFANYYFWRNYQGQEVDLIEERVGRLSAYEFKWSSRQKATALKVPTGFAAAYPEASFQLIYHDNFEQLFTDET